MDHALEERFQKLKLHLEKDFGDGIFDGTSSRREQY